MSDSTVDTPSDPIPFVVVSCFPISVTNAVVGRPLGLQGLVAKNGADVVSQAVRPAGKR